MGDKHGISWPDGGMVASDSGMSYHSCNKPDYHHRVKQLEKGYDELRSICNRQKERIAELEAQLAVADKGLLKASDPNSGWQGINKECKLWQAKAEELEAEVERLRGLLK